MDLNQQQKKLINEQYQRSFDIERIKEEKIQLKKKK